MTFRWFFSCLLVSFPATAAERYSVIADRYRNATMEALLWQVYVTAPVCRGWTAKTIAEKNGSQDQGHCAPLPRKVVTSVIPKAITRIELAI
jgi:hypothetical protein